MTPGYFIDYPMIAGTPSSMKVHPGNHNPLLSSLFLALFYNKTYKKIK